MPKVSFKKDNGGSAVAEPENHKVEEKQAEQFADQLERPTTAVAPTQDSHPVPYSGDADDVDMSEVVLPRLNIAQKVGDLGDTFDPGEVVFDGSLVLPRPVEFVVVGFAPIVFVEKVEGGGIGAMCNSEQEVADFGGTSDWNEAKATGKPLFQRMAKCMVLVKQAEGVEGAKFPYAFEGANYAIGVWNQKGTAYTKATRRIKTAKKIGHLRQTGYRGAFWKLDTAIEKRNGNSYYVPVLKEGPATTPEFRDWLAHEVVGH